MLEPPAIDRPLVARSILLTVLRDWPSRLWPLASGLLVAGAPLAPEFGSWKPPLPFPRTAGWKPPPARNVAHRTASGMEWGGLRI